MSSSQKLLALLVGACLVSLIAAHYKCPPGKKWHECACHKDHYCGGKGCTYKCEEGCVCQDSKYKLHENRCVHYKDCPSWGGKCPWGAEWSKCSGCWASCQKQGTVCRAVCEKEGCVCKDSKYKLQDNKCVHHKECRSWGGNH